MRKALMALVISGMGSLAFADGAALYKQCVTCHGEKGEKTALGGRSKVINTMSKEEIVTSLKGYRDKTYGGSMKVVMEKQLASFTDAQIDEVASHIMQIK